MILWLLYILILIVFIAEIGRDGLWHSILTFFNVLFSGTLTMNFFEPLALQLDIWFPSFSYFVDFFAFWGLFITFSLLIRLSTQALSKVRVRFLKPVDLAGGAIVSLWAGWIMISLVATSLHLAPLPVNSFGSFQSDPTPRADLNPDRNWLALMHRVSQGSFSRAADSENGALRGFDPEGEFILRYGARRGTLANLETLRVRRIWGSGKIQDDQP